MRTTAEEVAGSVQDCSPRRVFFAEWLEPPFCAGHWLPQMIELAGGADAMGRAGRPSFPSASLGPGRE